LDTHGDHFYDLKVGDLVTMPFSIYYKNIVGIIVDINPTRVENSSYCSVGVFWSDTQEIEYEPGKFLRVINEGRGSR
jgi:hypothetical protein